MSAQDYTITGRVAVIGERKQVTEKLAKRDLIIETEEGQYSQMVKVEFINDKIALLDRVRPGDSVTAHFNIRGRKSGNGEYYNQLTGWKI